jgi:hypothetical protein
MSEPIDPEQDGEKGSGVRVLVVVSSASELPLREGRKEPTWDVSRRAR